MVENHTDNFKKIKDSIYNYPLPLLEIKDKKLLEIIDNYLPYSVGMEFECHQKANFSVNCFENIPDIMHVDVDAREQRYRIPNGLKGMICLYNICTQLKINSELDLNSSNHYHFDFTDLYDFIPLEAFNLKDVIEELKTWLTAKDLTRMQGWVRFNSLKTLEIRIGEPSFDYNVIINRLLLGSDITKRLKIHIGVSQEEIKLKQLQKELEELKEKSTPILDNVNINNRIIKFNGK